MKHLLFVALVVVCCSCANFRSGLGNNLVTDSLEPRPMAQLVQRRTQLTNVWIHGFQRDSRGQKLFINFSFKQNNEEEYRTAIVTSNEFTVSRGAPIVFYNDLGSPTVQLTGAEARYDANGRLFFGNQNANFVFVNGSRIPYNEIDGINYVVGGDYILLKFKGRSAWTLSTLASPTEPILNLPPGLDFPECAGLRNGRLVILGRSRSGGVVCLVYNKTPDSYNLQEEIPLPWANATYDFDPESGRALVVGQGQMFAGYYLFDIQSKHRRRLGFAPSDNVLFLCSDLVHALK